MVAEKIILWQQLTNWNEFLCSPPSLAPGLFRSSACQSSA
jgi:hypothetical protein